METLQAIKKRFSVNSFLKKNLSHDKLVKMLQAGIQAPNAGNLQSFRFVIVRRDDLKVKLGKAAFKQAWIAQAPVVLVICSDNSELVKQYGNKAETYAIQNCSAAAENILLASTDLGIDSCWIGAFNSDEVLMALRLPRSIIPYIIIPLGYSKEKKKSKRFQLEHFLHFEEYGTQDFKQGIFPLEVKVIPKIEKETKKLEEQSKHLFGRLKKKLKKR